MSGESTGYMDVATVPRICTRCGALVDQAFTVEHDRLHGAALAPTSEGGE